MKLRKLPRIILASVSPRRKKILSTTGLPLKAVLESLAKFGVRV